MLEERELSNNEKYLVFLGVLINGYGIVIFYLLLSKFESEVAYLLTTAVLIFLTIIIGAVIFLGYKLKQKFLPKILLHPDHVKNNFDVYLLFSLLLAIFLSLIIITMISPALGIGYPRWDWLPISLFVNLPLIIVISAFSLIRTVRYSALSNWRWFYIFLALIPLSFLLFLLYIYLVDPLI